MKNGTVKVGNRELNVKIAITPLQQMRGMMGHNWQELSQTNIDGMLFVFSRNRRWGVEMPFCPPMDLVFVAHDRTINEVQKAQPMSWNPKTWKIYRSKEPCIYVLELPPGKGDMFEIGKRINLSFDK